MAVYTKPDPALASLVPGMRVAGYRLEEGIGQGGMAVVFRAQDERLKRMVALKLLAPGLIKDKTAQERFLNEAYAAAAVDHPHIVPVHDAGNSGGLMYIATKFVPGGDLRATLDREPGLPRPARIATLLSPVASALDAAHQVGLVHRDVKPANILVDSSPGRPDHVYLADFGVSKWTVLPSNMAGVDLTSVNLTGTGFFLGTPDYSAPEQVLGRPVGPATDQYALAVVAFMLLTGERMFPGDQLAVMYAQVSDAPPAATSLRPQLPAAVDDVLWRALAKDPGDRFGSCGAFADALRAALGLASYGSLAEGRGPATQSLIAGPRRGDAAGGTGIPAAGTGIPAGAADGGAGIPAGAADVGAGVPASGAAGGRSPGDVADGARGPAGQRPLGRPLSRSAARGAPGSRRATALAGCPGHGFGPGGRGPRGRLGPGPGALARLFLHPVRVGRHRIGRCLVRG